MVKKLSGSKKYNSKSIKDLKQKHKDGKIKLHAKLLMGLEIFMELVKKIYQKKK